MLNMDNHMLNYVKDKIGAVGETLAIAAFFLVVFFVLCCMAIGVIR